MQTIFTETVDRSDPKKLDSKGFTQNPKWVGSSKDPRSLHSNMYRDCFNTWTGDIRVDPKTRLLDPTKTNENETIVQGIINDPANAKELVIGADNKFNRYSTSRLLYHSSPGVNHWYNSMRHFYKVNNISTKRDTNLPSLKIILERIIIETDLGDYAIIGMEDYFSTTKQDPSVHKQVKSWWDNYSENLGWIDVLSMILPILDPSKMFPHNDQSDTRVGGQLHYASDVAVNPHILSSSMLTGKDEKYLQGLRDVTVYSYTKDNYLAIDTPSSISGVQSANHTNNTYVSNVNNWVYEKDKGVLPRISYLVNVYLQKNKQDITKILSCIDEGLKELRKSEFNKYSPLFYQINGTEVVPHHVDSSTAYFTKEAAEAVINKSK